MSERHLMWWALDDMRRMEMEKPTDKELATSVRDLFGALRRSIEVARDAGLSVEIDEDIHEILDEPKRTFSRPAFKIVRPL